MLNYNVKMLYIFFIIIIILFLFIEFVIKLFLFNKYNIYIIVINIGILNIFSLFFNNYLSVSFINT